MSAKFVKTLLSIQTIPQWYVPSPGSIRVFSSANKKSLLKKAVQLRDLRKQVNFERHLQAGAKKNPTS